MFQDPSQQRSSDNKYFPFGALTKTIGLWAVIFLGLHPCIGLAKAEEKARTNEDRYLVRFEWANDLLTGTDDGPTVSWGFSWHSRAMESWEEASKVSHWIGHVVPGLESTAMDGRMVKTSYGFSQTMQTPTDLTDPDLIPGDVPYAGALGGYASWYRLNNKQLRAFQVYVGMLGPASGAEQVQKFIHNDLDMGTDPKGWDNQLYNELLLNLNYEADQKIWNWGEQAERKFSTDLSIGVGGALGNYLTGAYLQAGWRLGWGLPRGFTSTVESGGGGIGMNPVIDVPNDKWSVYFSLSPRVSAVGYTVFLETNTFKNHPHPGVDYNRFPVVLNCGIHVSKQRFSLSWSANYFPDEVLYTEQGTDVNFGIFTIGYLF